MKLLIDIDDLIEAILALENDLNEDLKQLDSNYLRLSNEHTRTVQDLQQNIGAS